MWKEAFCSPANAVQQDVQAVRGQLPENLLKFDADVESLGGYKQLLIARYCAERNKERAEQSQGVGSSVLNLECAACSFRACLCFGGRILTLVRLRGKLWMWAMYPQNKDSFYLADTCSSFLNKESLGVPLQPLCPVESQAVVKGICQTGTVHGAGYISSNNGPAGPISVEFYRDPPSETRPRWGLHPGPTVKEQRNMIRWKTFCPQDAWVNYKSWGWYSLRGLLSPRSEPDPDDVFCDVFSYLVVEFDDLTEPKWRIRWEMGPEP